MGSVKAPPPRSIAVEGEQALDAQLGLAGPTFNAEAQFRPRYAALDLATLDTFLRGDPNFQRVENNVEQINTADLMSRYGVPFDAPAQSPIRAQAAAALQRDGWRPVDGDGFTGMPQRYQRVGTRTVAAPQRGLLDIYANDIAPAQAQAQQTMASAQRMGDIADVRNLSGGARSAFDSLNPLAAQNFNDVARMDSQQLGMGAQLDPFQQRAIEQGYRSALTARGLSLGEGDAAGEALAAFAGGEQMRQMRRGNALQSATALQGFYGDPFQQILGRPSGSAQGLLNSAQAQGGRQGSQLFDPFNAYASDVFNTNYNADASARIASGNQQTAIIGSVLGMIGGAAGGMR